MPENTGPKKREIKRRDQKPSIKNERRNERGARLVDNPTPTKPSRPRNQKKD